MWWPPSTMWVGSLIYSWPPPGMSEWSHLFELGLCAACWAHFMCHHELWPTSLSHPFSSLNSSSGFARWKHYQNITIPIFRLVFQNFAIPGCFPYILFCPYLFSLLSSGWFVIAVCGSISVRELIKFSGSMQTDVELPSPMTSQLNGCPHFFVFFFLISFFLKCRLCVIYVREDNDSNVLVMITRLVWTIWTSISAVPKKAVELNHSLTHFHISFHKCLADVSYTIGKSILKFVFENFSFEIADAYQSLTGTCVAPMAINKSCTFALVPHDNCDIVVIYMRSTKNEEQVVFMLFHVYCQKDFCCYCMINLL